MSAHSNTVLSSVRLVTLTFDDDPERAMLEELGAAVVASPWYATVGAEYGVGPGEQLARVHLGPAPSSLTPAEALGVVEQAIAQHRAPIPASRADQLLYMLHVPSTVDHAAITRHGFHTRITVNGVQAPVAVAIGDVDPPSTVTAARLLINTATDPYATPTDGYYVDPPGSDPWSLVRGEVADLCEREPIMPLDDAHPTLWVPRVYSNSSGAAGPCVPAGADEIWVDVSADPTRIQPVERGGEVLFRLTGWSTRDTGDWTVQVEPLDGSGLSPDQMSPELNAAVLNNGVRATLVLHVPATADIGTVGAVYVVSGPNRHPWPVAFRVE